MCANAFGSLLTFTVVEKSRDHKSKGVGSIILPTLYIIKEDGDPSLKLWAQTLLVEDRADQGESIVQWISKLREKVCQSRAIETAHVATQTWKIQVADIHPGCAVSIMAQHIYLAGEIHDRLASCSKCHGINRLGRKCWTTCTHVVVTRIPGGPAMVVCANNILRTNNPCILAPFRFHVF